MLSLKFLKSLNHLVFICNFTESHRLPTMWTWKILSLRAWRDAYFNSRDEIENFFLSVSCFETRSRISSLQSHASRRDREFFPFSLMLRDEIKNFFLSVSCFETRSRISFLCLMLRDEIENFCLHSRASRRDQEECWKKCTFVEGWRPFFLAQTLRTQEISTKIH